MPSELEAQVQLVRTGEDPSLCMAFAARQYNQARDQLSQLLSDPGKRTRDVLKLDNDLKTLGY